MDSAIVITIPIMALVALCMGTALPFIAAGRRARPSKPGGHDAARAEYLYVPCTLVRHHPAGTRRWVQQVPIVKKTAEWIYYTSGTWDRSEVVVSPGRISRQQFETDTRCHDDCPADTRGVRCAQHGYSWEHCSHGGDRCRHGYPAGVIPVPDDLPHAGPADRRFFATREAAETDLHPGRGERAGRDAPKAPPIKELRRAMADAHPDRGGTSEQFIQARRRYQTALQAAGR
jgi:hypothetical protein